MALLALLCAPPLAATRSAFVSQPNLGAEISPWSDLPESNRSKEIQSFTLPNGLKVITMPLANTGIVSARLVLSWTEGTESAPFGTAWILSKVLPSMGSGGMDRADFQIRKDQAGTISHIAAGDGRMAWTFDALSANADMMIQLLADEALRPAWTLSETLPEVLNKAWDSRHLSDERLEAIQAFKRAIKDPQIPQLPDAPIDTESFFALWANLRRPENATLSVVGDIESLALRRLIFQHFGPWEGVRSLADESTPGPLKHATDELIAKYHKGDSPEIWIGWNLDALPSEESAIFTPLVPLVSWLLKLTLPVSDEIIKTWQADQRWLCATGQPGVSPDILESHLKSLLNLPVTQELLDKAIAARNEYTRADTLNPHRALDVMETEMDTAPPELDVMKRLMEKWRTLH